MCCRSVPSGIPPSMRNVLSSSNAISSAINTVVGFFRSIGQFFVGIWQWLTGLFDSIAQGIMSFLQPVVDFFRGVGRAIKAVFDGIRDFVIRLLRRIPDALLPESLERLSRQPLSTEVRTEDEFEAVGRTRATADRAEAAFHEADRLFPCSDRRPLAPARIMGAIYHSLLRRMRGDRFRVFEKRYRVPTPAKALILIRHSLAARLP